MTNLLLSIAQIGSYIFYIVIALLILMLMITIHEFGHYTAGKILKFKIDEFSVGFGKAIFSKKTKGGEIFSVRLIPLGGYCAFAGEDGLNEPNENSQNVLPSNAENANIKNLSTNKKGQAKSFSEQPPWKRIIVLLAGVLFNFVSAIIFCVILLVGFGYDIPEVKYVDATGVNSHLSQGDIITYVEGERVDYIYGSTLNALIAKYNTEDTTAINITILRNNEEIATTLNKFTEEVDGKQVASFQVNIGAHRHNLWEAISRSVPLTFAFAGKILEFLGMLVTGQMALNSITGPVTTITTIANYTQQSIANLFVFLPFISVNLAVFNILPIPSLDGSKIIFTIIEWIRGKKVNPRIENAIHAFGLLVLIAFVVFVDVFNIFFA